MKAQRLQFYTKDEKTTKWTNRRKTVRVSNRSSLTESYNKQELD